MFKCKTQEGIPADQVSAYTYGSPRPFLEGKGHAGIKQQANAYNLVNPNDYVTHVGTVHGTPRVTFPEGFEIVPTYNESIGRNIVLPHAGADHAHSLDTYEAAMRQMNRGGGAGGGRF